MQMQIQDRRRAALARWIEHAGGHAKVVARYGLTASKASYLSQICNGYTFGEKSARSWETLLGIPKGWLDSEGTGEVPAAYVAQPRTVTLEEALERLGMALAEVPKPQREDVADDLHHWAMHGGRDIHRAAVAESLARSNDVPTKLTGT